MDTCFFMVLQKQSAAMSGQNNLGENVQKESTRRVIRRRPRESIEAHVK